LWKLGVENKVVSVGKWGINRENSREERGFFLYRKPDFWKFNKNNEKQIKKLSDNLNTANINNCFKNFGFCLFGNFIVY